MAPDYSSVLKACLQDLAQVPVQLLAKLPADIQLTSVEAQPIKVPKASRFLRFYTPSDSIKGGDVQEPEESMSGADLSLCPMRAVFGLPWSPEDFIRKAAELGHPAKAELSVPQVLERAIKQNLVWNDEQLTKYNTEQIGVGNGSTEQSNWRRRSLKTGPNGLFMFNKAQRTNG